MASGGKNVCSPNPPSSPRERSPDSLHRGSPTPPIDPELKRRRVQVKELKEKNRVLEEKKSEFERDASLAWDITAAQQLLVSCHEQLEKVSSTRPLDDPEEFRRLQSEKVKCKTAVNETGFIDNLQ